MRERRTALESLSSPGEGPAVAGRLSRIPWEADRQTHELIVEVTPERLERRMAIGQRADVRIEIARRDAALRIPTRMIHHDEAGPFVYADRGGRITVVRPRFGLTGADHVEVREGLAEGDAVLAAPRPALTLPAGRRWVAR